MTDTFSFNHEFTAPLQRIKIQTVASKAETTEERRETEEKVEEERKLQTEVRLVCPFETVWLICRIGLHRTSDEG